MSGYAVDKTEKIKGGLISVSFDGVSRGTLFISDAAIPITDGYAAVTARDVSEGRNPVSVFKEHSRESFDCGYIVRSGNTLSAEPEDTQRDFIYLKRELYAERNARRSLEKRIAGLEEKINGYKIF